MFDWLEIQINEVKAGSINRVEGVGRGISAEGAAERLTRFPNSYREFCARFGNVFLYKLRNAYQVIVNNTPQQTTDSSGRVLHCFGSNDDKTAYFVDELLEEGDDTPILELSEEGFNLASIGFNEWIWNACAEAIARYEPDEWQVLLAGHLPFSEKERQLIQWRQLYLWECLGISSSGKIRFQITNNSPGVMPFISVGLTNFDKSFNGRVYLPTTAILPGQTAIIENDCYSDCVSPSELNAYSLSDPKPEDRYEYWEFRDLHAELR